MLPELYYSSYSCEGGNPLGFLGLSVKSSLYIKLKNLSTAIGMLRLNVFKAFAKLHIFLLSTCFFKTRKMMSIVLNKVCLCK